MKVMLSYPDAMRREIERKGMEWWAKGGDYASFAAAIDDARSIAEEKRFPIQLKCLGNKMTVYPKSVGY